MILFRETWRCPKHRVIQVFKRNTPEFSTCTMNAMIAMNRTGSGRPNGKESSRAQGIFPNKHFIICHINDGMNHAGRKHCEMQRLIPLKHPCNTGISSFVGNMIGLTLVCHGLHVPNALPCRAAWLFCFFGLSLASQIKQQSRLLRPIYWRSFDNMFTSWSFVNVSQRKTVEIPSGADVNSKYPLSSLRKQCRDKTNKTNNTIKHQNVTPKNITHITPFHPMPLQWSTTLKLQ